MMSQPWKQAIATYILPKIPRSKGNRAIKIVQLIDYNMTNIFLEKSYTKYVAESIPKPFSRQSKLSISLNQ